MCNSTGHGYCISYFPGEMPNWMSYSGEGCLLSFHIPPVFQGLVLWFVYRPLATDVRYCLMTRIIIIIRNKSNGIQLLEDERTPEIMIQRTGGWIRYISRSEMTMEDYCGDDELELYIHTERTGFDMRNGHSLKPVQWRCARVKECGVHVIAGKSDSFEESEVERDTVMPSQPLYHLLPHPHRGSITVSTPKQWSDFLFAKLQEHSLDLWLHGKNIYFL